MNSVQRHTTLPTRSRYSRRQLHGDKGSDSSALPLSTTPRPSTASGFYPPGDSNLFDPPSVQLFGTVGKSPMIVRKTLHSKGGSFHSLQRSTDGREKIDQEDSNLNVHREIRKSVRYKPAPILAHTIVINRTTEIIKEPPAPPPPASLGSFEDVSLNEFVPKSGSNELVKGEKDIEFCVAEEDLLIPHKDRSGQKQREASHESQGENVLQSIETKEQDNGVYNKTRSQTAKPTSEDRLRMKRMNIINREDGNGRVEIVKTEAEETEENWITETEEIRWKVITETFSDGSVRYFTVKEGEEMRKAEVVDATDTSPTTRVRSGNDAHAYSRPMAEQVSQAPTHPFGPTLGQPPPPPPRRALDLSAIHLEESDAALVEEQRRRIAEIEYLQEQLCQHLNCGPTSGNYENVDYNTPVQSTPIKRFEDEKKLRRTGHLASSSQACEENREKYEHRESSHGYFSQATDLSRDQLGMPESDQHLVIAVGPESVRDINMGEVLLSDDMSFDAIAAEIRRTMTQTGSVLGQLIEQKEKNAIGSV